jgi:GNAT superfamily N-acetyltransferase
VAELLARAFRDNPMNRAVLRRGPAARVRANRLGARLLLGRAEGAGHVLVASAEENVPQGALVGFEPTRLAPDRPSLRQIGLLLRQGPGATLRWGRVQAELAEIRPVEPHWTLAMVGVDPVAQGRGLGAAVVARWVEGIARAPAPAWVETDRPELVPFYQRFGFEPRARREIFGVEVAGLLRPAP